MTKYTVGIACVDGVSDLSLTCTSAQQVLNFLSNEDHEGSSVSVVVACEDAEKAYEILRKCVEIDEVFRPKE